MAEQFTTLGDEHRRFIDKQKIFFVATGAREGSLNLSPKGGPTLCVQSERRLLWLNLTGSGNETAAHLLDTNRITLMWCAFEGSPLILRVYGRARAIYPEDAEWKGCTEQIPAIVGARQYYSIEIDRVQTSCGYQVPLMDYREDRSALTKWAEKKGEDGLREYRAEKNVTSIDGLPTRASRSA